MRMHPVEGYHRWVGRGSGFDADCEPGVGVVDLDSDVFSWLPELLEEKHTALRRHMTASIDHPIPTEYNHRLCHVFRLLPHFMR